MMISAGLRQSLPRIIIKASTRHHTRVATTTGLRLLSSSDGPDSAEQNRLFKEQMEEMNEERQALFGFTDKDQNAWGNAGGDHKHAPSLLEEIERARQESLVAERAPAAVETTDSLQEEEWSSTGLTHLSNDGKAVHMVDIGAKTVSQRVAVARSTVVFPPEVMKAFDITKGDDTGDLVGPKGPIFATAKLAGIMAAKKTSDLIPLCHPLPLDQVNINIHLENGNTAVIECECRVTHKTGVEMEALTGASVAALTIYDMVKALSHQIRIEQTVLVHKSGGKRTVGPQE